MKKHDLNKMISKMETKLKIFTWKGFSCYHIAPCKKMNEILYSFDHLSDAEEYLAEAQKEYDENQRRLKEIEKNRADAIKSGDFLANNQIASFIKELFPDTTLKTAASGSQYLYIPSKNISIRISDHFKPLRMDHTGTVFESERYSDINECDIYFTGDYTKTQIVAKICTNSNQ